MITKDFQPTIVPLLWKSQQGKRSKVYTTNRGKITPKWPSFIITYLVYEFINYIPEPLVGQFQRSRAISICRRTDERVNTFSKNIVRTGGTDKEHKNFPEMGDGAADE